MVVFSLLVYFRTRENVRLLIINNLEEEAVDEVEVEEGEETIIHLKCLIATVKANPALYSKNKKEYAGKNLNKQLAWTSVGNALLPPMSGKCLRQMNEWRLHVE